MKKPPRGGGGAVASSGHEDMHTQHSDSSWLPGWGYALGAKWPLLYYRDMLLQIEEQETAF